MEENKEEDKKNQAPTATEELPAVVDKASRKRAAKVSFADKEDLKKKKEKKQDVAKVRKKPTRASKKPKLEEPPEKASTSKGSTGEEETPPGRPCTPEGKQPPRLPYKTQARVKLDTWYFKALKEYKQGSKCSSKAKKKKKKQKGKKSKSGKVESKE